ncbi:5757_t:CDS:2, partial [Scutellospora calospora]
MDESTSTNLNMSNEFSQTDTLKTNNNTLKRKSVGRLKEKIWEFYITSNVTNNRSATCHYCSKYWSCGCPSEMEAHLANICPSVPKDIKENWQELLLDKITNYKRTKSSNQKHTNQLDLSPNHHANALLKEGLANLQIKGGDLKLYIKTRWCSLWNTADSLLRACSIFEWIKRLKKRSFRRICEIAANYWKALGNDEYSYSDLLADLRKYKRIKDPFDMKYKKESELALNWWLTFDE